MILQNYSTGIIFVTINLFPGRQHLSRVTQNYLNILLCTITIQDIWHIQFIQCVKCAASVLNVLNKLFIIEQTTIYIPVGNISII